MNQNIILFEKKLKVTLPFEYRDFILKYEGKKITPNIFKENAELGPVVLNSLYSFKAKNSYDDIEETYEIYDGRIMNTFLSIGCDPGGNQFCLGLAGTFINKIYFWDHNEEVPENEFLPNSLPENMYFLANSFHSFISDLIEEDEL